MFFFAKKCGFFHHEGHEEHKEVHPQIDAGFLIERRNS